jgi:hypothetical protein
MYHKLRRKLRADKLHFERRNAHINRQFAAQSAQQPKRDKTLFRGCENNAEQPILTHKSRHRKHDNDSQTPKNHFPKVV